MTSRLRAVRTLNFALGALLAGAALFSARDILSGGVGPGGIVARGVKPAATAKTPARQKTIPPFDYYASIVKENIFGFEGEQPRLLSSTPLEVSAPSSAMLIGTVTGAINYAIILVDSKEEVFRVGEELPGLGRLRSVKRDSIVLEGPAGERKLQLADIAQIKEAPAAQSISRGPQASAGQRPPFVRESSKSSFIVDKSAVADAIENPAKILTHARLLPNISGGPDGQGGAQEGFIVTEVKPGGIFEELGLKNGDVLLRINRFEISGPDAALKAFTALKGFDRVELDIIRGGNRQTLTYLIR